MGGLPYLLYLDPQVLSHSPEELPVCLVIILGEFYVSSCDSLIQRRGGGLMYQEKALLHPQHWTDLVVPVLDICHQSSYRNLDFALTGGML